MTSTFAAPVSAGHVPPMGCLLAFEAVARTQSLGRAASELGLTRSALTHSIGTLEQRLRLKLVQQYSPWVQLTAAGQDYLQTAQDFLHQLRDELHASTPSVTRQLRVSASRGLARLWLAPRLGGFLRAQPGVHIVLSVADRLESVLGAGVDIGLRYGGDVLPGMVSVPLWTDELVAVASPAWARVARELDPRNLLQRVPLIEHPSIGWSQWAAEALGHELSVQPRLRTRDLHVAIEAAVAGNGLALAHRRLVQAGLDAGRLALAHPHAMAARAYHAVASRAQLRRVPVRSFLDWLREQVALDDQGLQQRPEPAVLPLR